MSASGWDSCWASWPHLLQWSGWPAFLAVLAVYGIGQLLENYVLVPWLVGDRIGLHPLAVIFALLAFGQLFGFAGVLLALPASAALLVGLRHLRAAYLESPVYRGDSVTGAMEQLIFELAAARAAVVRQLSSPARNAEAVAALRQFAAGDAARNRVWCCGAPPGVGTHALAARRGRGGRAQAAGPAYLRGPRACCRPTLPVAAALVPVDDVDRADPAAQGRLFTLYNRLQGDRGPLLAAAARRPARLPLARRPAHPAGWGLVYEILPLADADKPAALARYARASAAFGWPTTSSPTCSPTAGAT